MKNRFKMFGFIAIAAVIGFSMAACGGDDNDGGGGNGSFGNTLTITNAQVYSVDFTDSNIQLIEFTDTVQDLNYVQVLGSSDDSGSVLKSLNELIDGNPTVTLINGKLNVTLGTPKTSSLQNLDTGTMPQGITVSKTGVKAFFLERFYNISSDQSVSQYRTDSHVFTRIIYIYSNKDVNINGTYTAYTDRDNEYSYTVTYAINLKTGWNSVIETPNQTREITFWAGTPTADCKWVISQ